MLFKSFPKTFLQGRSFCLFQKHFARKKFSSVPQKKNIGIIGVPFSKGQRKDGVQHGPAVLRSTDFMKDLMALGYSVKDFGEIDIEVEPNDPQIGLIRNPLAVGKTSQKVSEKVCQVVKEGKVCITLGGDHSIGIGTVHGHAQANPNLCLIWIDAHSDVNTTSTTITGNMHGLPLSYHFHETFKYNKKLPGLEWVKPSLMVKDAAYIGLRDIDPLERLIMKKFGFNVFSMREVDQLGIIEVTSRVLNAINPDLDRPIHVSFDIDSMDASLVPSTIIPVPGGLTLREGQYLGEEIYKTGKLAALDIVEVNPTIGTKEDLAKTLTTAQYIIRSFFGSYRGGNLPLDVTEIPQH